MIKKKGNVVYFTPPKTRLPKEYRGSNIDPEDYKDEGI